MQTLLSLNSKDKSIDAIEAGVIGRDDAVAGMEAVRDSGLFRSSGVQVYGAPYSIGTVLIEHEHPGTTGSFQKRAGWQQSCRDVIAQFKFP